MVGVVQWLERQIVALEIVGSTPTTHPILFGIDDVPLSFLTPTP